MTCEYSYKIDVTITKKHWTFYGSVHTDLSFWFNKIVILCTSKRESVVRFLTLPDMQIFLQNPSWIWKRFVFWVILIHLVQTKWLKKTKCFQDKNRLSGNRNKNIDILWLCPHQFVILMQSNYYFEHKIHVKKTL